MPIYGTKMITKITPQKLTNKVDFLLHRFRSYEPVGEIIESTDLATGRLYATVFVAGNAITLPEEVDENTVSEADAIIQSRLKFLNDSIFKIADTLNY